MAERGALLHRVAQALLDLALVSEGPGSPGFNAIGRRQAESAPPPGRADRSLLEEHTARLEGWLRDVDRDLQLAHKSPDVAPETPKQLRARIIAEHAGRNYRMAAAIERLSPAYIRKIRVQAGVSPLDGRPAKGAQRPLVEDG